MASRVQFYGCILYDTPAVIHCSIASENVALGFCDVPCKHARPTKRTALRSETWAKKARKAVPTLFTPYTCSGP